jgi:hypothetical protein
VSSSGSEDVKTSNTPRPFVYISAEDIFRPVIPAKYIETKREAEKGIESMMVNKPGYRGVYMRPSMCFPFDAVKMCQRQIFTRLSIPRTPSSSDNTCCCPTRPIGDITLKNTANTPNTFQRPSHPRICFLASGVLARRYRQCPHYTPNSCRSCGGSDLRRVRFFRKPHSRSDWRKTDA